MAVLVVAVLVYTGEAFAAGSGPEWHASPLPVTASVLNAVRCGSPSACLAVGYDGQGAIADQWNGAHWTAVSPVNPAPGGNTKLNGLSCAGPRFCMAVGSDSNSNGTQVCGLAERWNGTSWSLASGTNRHSACPSGISGAGSLSDVSCTSSRFCLAVGGPVARRWNGSSWSAVRVPRVLGFTTVSCRAVNGCAAGGAGNAAYGLGWWNGRSWAARTIADKGGYDPETEGPVITGISCTWVKFCIAVGGDGTRAVAFQWNGRRWIPRSNGAFSTTDYYDYPGPVSCAATNACTTAIVGPLTSETLNSYFFNGSRWSLSGTLPGDGANVSGISCVSARACMAVGDEYAADSF